MQKPASNDIARPDSAGCGCLVGLVTGISLAVSFAGPAWGMPEGVVAGLIIALTSGVGAYLSKRFGERFWNWLVVFWRWWH